MSKEFDVAAARQEIGRTIIEKRTAQGVSRNKARLPEWGSASPLLRIEEGRANYTIDNLTKYLDRLGLRLEVVEKEEE